MKFLEKNLIWLYGIAAAKMLLVLYLAYAFLLGVQKTEYHLLDAQRNSSIAQVANTISIMQYTPKSAPVIDIIRNRTPWTNQITEHETVEIYPVYPKTGRSVFESSLTGTMSQDALESLTSSSDKPTYRIVKDHRDHFVFRVSALENFGGTDYVVNADVDVFEVVGNYKMRLFLHLLIIFMVLWTINRTRGITAAVETDSMSSNSEKTFLYKIMAAALEVLEVDVCIAEMDDNGRSSIVFATRDFHRMMGYSRGELNGMPLEIFIQDDRQDWHEEQVRMFHAQDDEIPGRIVNPVTKTGEVIEVNLRVRRTQPVWSKRYLVASIRR